MFFSYASSVLTDVGLHRKNNEDAYVHLPELGLFGVFDGMGGHADGEIASQMAADLVQQYIASKAYAQIHARTYLRCRHIEKILVESLQHACEQIFSESHRQGHAKGMGTTASVMFVHEKKVTIAHVGDSRIYLLRGQSKIRLTEDHTLAQAMVESGALKPEEALTSPYSNHLTRVLGIQPSVHVDVATYDILPHDRFILCSDGLTRYEQTGAGALPSELDLEPKAQLDAFRTWSRKHGGRDNMTAMVVDLHPQNDSSITLVPSYKQLPVEQAISTLKHIVLFKHLCERDVMNILDRCEHSVVPQDTMIFEDGDDGELLYFIINGTVAIEKDGACLATLTDGDHFGEMALIGEYARSATARTQSDAQLLALSRSDFYELLKSNAVFARKLLWNFLWMQSRRLRATSQQSHLSLLDSVEHHPTTKYETSVQSNSRTV